MVSSTGDQAPVKDHRPRSRWFVRVGLGLAGLILVVVVLNILPTINDPTEGTFSVKVVNSLGQRVEFRMCDDSACRSTVDRTTLDVGEEFDQNIQVAARIPFRVMAADGRLLGCWVLSVPRRAPDERVAVSNVSPCATDWLIGRWF
jgi:hypothetical protein